MGGGSTIFRVGAAVVLVGQAAAGCGHSGPPALPPAELSVPLLGQARSDAGAGKHEEGVLFGHPMPVAGSGWNVSLQAVSRSLDPPAAPGGLPGGEQVASYESEYRVEVLVVDGPIPSRVHLHFLRNVQIFQGRESPTSVHGKDYVVDARAPHVRDRAGSPVQEIEAQRVLDVFSDLGSRSRIDEVLPAEPMRIGDRRDELAGAILRAIHPRAWSMRAGTARLARVEQDHAVFDLTLDASSDGGLHMVLDGHARIRLRDARLSDLALDGSYETSGDAGSRDPPGTFSLRRRVGSGP